MPRAVKKPASRGRLKSLRVSDSFRAYVLEQLSGVKGLLPRAMFGGVGLYAGDDFFGIIAADALYFKVDDSNRGSYETAGMTAFKPYADRPMSMSYWRVPVGVLEDADELTIWARAAIQVAKATGKGSATRPILVLRQGDI